MVTIGAHLLARLTRARAGGEDSPRSQKADSTANPMADSRAELLIHRRSWSIAEYQSLRDESIVAQSNQQSALNWGLALVSAATVGGLALSARDGDIEPVVMEIQLLIFGFILPVLLFAISLVWLGEFVRMARVGAYIRLVEDSVRVLDCERSVNLELSADPPIGWENALSGGNSRFPERLSRNNLGYAGAGMILAGGQISSAILWGMFQVEYQGSFWFLTPNQTSVGVVALIALLVILELWFAIRATRATRLHE